MSIATRRSNILRVVLLAIVCLGFAVSPSAPVAAPGDLIQRVSTDKARYSPNSAATITVEIKNNAGASWNGTLYLDIRHLETLTYSTSQPLSVASGATTTKTFAWTTPSTDFRGYHVEVRAGTTDSGTTAIDVSSSWTRYPRYGYVHAFPSGQTQAQSAAKIKQLSEDYLEVTRFRWSAPALVDMPHVHESGGTPRCISCCRLTDYAPRSARIQRLARPLAPGSLS